MRNSHIARVRAVLPKTTYMSHKKGENPRNGKKKVTCNSFKTGFCNVKPVIQTCNRDQALWGSNTLLTEFEMFNFPLCQLLETHLKICISVFATTPDLMRQLIKIRGEQSWEEVVNRRQSLRSTLNPSDSHIYS